MVPTYRYFEIIVFSLLNFLPFMILALYPFRDSLRFSVRITILLAFILSCIQIGTGIFAAILWRDGASILSLFSTATYLLFYFVVAKGHPGKKTFILLIISNIANLIVISSKYLESRLFHDMALQSYRYSFSICMFLIEVIVSIPLFFFVKSFSRLSKDAHTPDKLWNYLWFVPATFYLIWYYHLYSSTLSSLELALRLDNLLWIIAINAGAMLIYAIIFQMIYEMKKNEELSNANRILEIQKVQSDALDLRFREIRQARHDLRHHIHLMNAFIKDQKYSELQEYLTQYQEEINDDTTLYFCEHYSMNALFYYYALLAQQRHISYQVSVQIPKNLSIPDSALTVLFSNLLENALDSCTDTEYPQEMDVTANPAPDSSSDREQPFIHVKGKMDGTLLFVMIENSCKNPIRTDANGEYLSTKHEGTGIGLSSVLKTVSRYHGKMELEEKNNTFCVSLLLPAGEKKGTG